MSVADKALWVIERNSGQVLSLNAIAKACGVSRSHLANAFGSATGLSVVKYLRMRRLTEAARALARGAPNILALALDADYGSHEAFTRAFRDQFGVAPETVRDRGSVDGLALVEPFELKARKAGQLDPPRMTSLRELRIVGLAETCSFETTIKIPAQWQRFVPYYDAIPAKADPIPVGVHQAPDDDGQFGYVCGVEVTNFADAPDELVRLEIPPSRYAVFGHRGHVSTIYETYFSIWNEALPACGCTAADAPILERHNATFDPSTGDGGLTLWIPIAE